MILTREKQTKGKERKEKYKKEENKRKEKAQIAIVKAWNSIFLAKTIRGYI